MLTCYGVYDDIGMQGAVFLFILFVVGIIVAMLLKNHRVRLLASVCAVGLLVLLEIGIIVPTPTALSGDGYAITQEISLILATYLAPVVIGIVLGVCNKIFICFYKKQKEENMKYVTYSTYNIHTIALLLWSRSRA